MAFGSDGDVEEGSRVEIITTVIPTYKRPQMLKRAIKSALAQTYPHIRVCVYDNASHDETEQVVLQFADPRIVYFRHEATMPAPENFQFGLKRVQTPFFSILADDDVLLPNFYETALNALKSSPEALFFVGSTIDVHENGNVISANALKWPREGLWNPPEGLYQVVQYYVNWAGTLFRKEVLTDVNIDPNLTAIDLDFVTRLAAIKPFVFSKMPSALFVHHKQSYSSQCGAKLVWPGYKKIGEKIATPALMQNALAKRLYRILITAIAKKNFSEAEIALEIYEKEFQTHLQSIQRLLSACKKSALISSLFSKFFYKALFFKRMPLQKKYRYLVCHLNQVN